MKKKFRQIFSVTAILLLVFALSSPSFAATTYPTAKLLTAPKSIKRGKKGTMKFILNSGSYTKYNGVWRAEFDLRIYNSKGTRVAWNGKDGTFFNGNLTYAISWTPPKSLKKGRYKVNYRTYFNIYYTDYRWYYNKYTTNKSFYITVK